MSENKNEPLNNISEDKLKDVTGGGLSRRSYYYKSGLGCDLTWGCPGNLKKAPSSIAYLGFVYVCSTCGKQRQATPDDLK